MAVDSRSIEPKLKICIEGLKSLHSKLSAQNKASGLYGYAAQFANQYDRICLWAHDVKVWDSVLDEQLRMSSSLRDCIWELLSDLAEQHDVVPSETTIESTLEEVTDIVDNLISLEPALRSPAPLDQFSTKIPEVFTARLPASTEMSHGIVVAAERLRFTNNKADLDIVVVPGPIIKESTWSAALNPFTRLLPDVLEENGVHARIMSFSYTPKYLNIKLVDDETLDPVVNKLVQDLNKARYGDPERPLFFIGLSLGGILAKGAISTIISEGLIVNTERPVCGCMFLAVPHDIEPARIRLWLSTVFGADISPDYAKPLIRFNDAFARDALRHKIDVSSFYPTNRNISTIVPLPNTEEVTPRLMQSTFIPMDRETILPMAHAIARIAEPFVSIQQEEHELIYGGQMLSAKSGSRQNEDPFAMLVAYDTAILVNDSSTASAPVWASFVEIVRDCVDIVIGYRDDVDLQLYTSKRTRFSVTESAKASRILADLKPPGIPWDLAAHLLRYLRGYRSSPSSILPDGSLRPCNLIILTAHAPNQTVDSLLKIISAAVDRPSSTIAPTFRLPSYYKSHSYICKRILLGAISPRFATISLSALDPKVSRYVKTGILESTTDSTSEIGSLGSAEWPHSYSAESASTATTNTKEDANQFSPTGSMSPCNDKDWGISFQQLARQATDIDSNVLSSADIWPRLGTMDSFRPSEHNSPLLNAQSPTIYDELSSIGSFYIPEAQPGYSSPAHSPPISPYLRPLPSPLDPGYSDQGYQSGPGNIWEMYLPETNIDFAPPSRQASFGPSEPPQPDKDVRRNRGRTMSDASMQTVSPVGSPILRPITTGRRRSSKTSMTLRDYILDLADPSGATPQMSSESAELKSNAKRTQKHLATFQCTLCPKRFTRAYNLRSHLRTHTEERPFVCSVCGKAFARQHDRKRHEGLHSGEKKFVCRGVLAAGGNWGCGRRFARVDALGRHFRGEAGQVCIRPLLEEEGEALKQDLQSEGADAQPTPLDPSMHISRPTRPLPVALYEQYPALATILWDSLASEGAVEDDVGSQSSFEASTELYDDEFGSAVSAMNE